MTQTLLFDVSRKTKKGLIYMNLDSESCYDRMVPNYGTVALSLLGFPQSIGVTLAKNQHQMSHHVKTIHGISDHSIKQNQSDIWGGIGQGSAASGTMWIIIKAPMITTFNTIHQQMQMQSPDNKTSYQTQISGFIDDDNINITVSPSDDPKTLKQTITSIISTWN